MNIDINQNYWLTVEPYVYINFAHSSVLLYNTLDAQYIESTNPLIVRLVHKISEKKNCGVCLLTGRDLKIDEVREFVIDIRQKFIGDIIPVKFSESKPVQLIPFLNFQQDRTRLSLQPNISIGDNVLDYLHEINFLFDKHNELKIERLNDVIEQVENVPVVNLCGNIWKYSSFSKLLQLLNKISGRKIIINNYEEINVDNVLSSNIGEEYTFLINIRFPINKEKWKSLVSLMTLSKWKIKFVFGVESEKHLKDAERLINEYKIENYQLLPVYNNKNIAFFKKSVYLNREDIFSAPLSMREIFANKTLNIYNFGKLFVKSNGDVFVKGSSEIIGNVEKDTIKEIIYNEISNGKSWLSIRNKQPCTMCLYQWLCPSPSDFELSIGRPNLCHVHP